MHAGITTNGSITGGGTQTDPIAEQLLFSGPVGRCVNAGSLATLYLTAPNATANSTYLGYMSASCSSTSAAGDAASYTFGQGSGCASPVTAISLGITETVSNPNGFNSVTLR